MSEMRFVDVFGNPEEPDQKNVIGRPGNRFIQFTPDGKPIVVNRDKNQDQTSPERKVEPDGRKEIYEGTIGFPWKVSGHPSDCVGKSKDSRVEEKKVDFWSGFVCGIVATLVIGIIFGVIIYFLVQYLNN